MGIPRVVEMARDLVSRNLPGDGLAVDATVGNGHDTLWLARRVGPRGSVVGIDLQQEALIGASRRLLHAGVLDRVALIRSGHERIGSLIRSPGPRGRPSAIMFNLGYLPGGDRSVVTRPESTILALKASMEVVAPGGIITVVLYPGHPAGLEESRAVERWAIDSVSSRAELLRVDPIHPNTPPPWLLAISPRKGVKPTGNEGR
jgi:predicted methyltransferase